MGDASVLLRFERRHADSAVRTTAATAATASESRTGQLIDLVSRRGGVMEASLDAETYPLLRDHLVHSILATATPERAERLFPGDPQQLLRPFGSVSLGSGAAGVLGVLATVGTKVPTELVDWLEGAVPGMEGPGPGLVDGLGGIALALDRLGRHEAAGRIWHEVERAPLDRLGTALADGLPGLGLALLERAPFSDGEALCDRIFLIAEELVRRLEDGAHDLRRPGLLHGGAGAALFLLHVYEMTADRRMLAQAERALRHDLAFLGWADLAAEGAPELWRTRPLLGSGSAGVAMVLHEALNHLDTPWMLQARDAIAEACERRVGSHAGLLHGWAGTLVALHYLRSRPWDPPADRHAVVRPHLERLAHPAARARIPFVGLDASRSSADLGTGAAGVLLALEHLLGEGERRLPLFW
ncbi:lanthionine synthetase C family protein [Georgenia ruanii]|nr:lanthionine synthetase C family protein [Georgenia ruanii]